MMEFIFWISFLLICYIYVGYPILLYVSVKFLKRFPSEFHDFLPTVSIIIPVHNEEQVIGEKLTNLLSLGYPQEKLEILVISDASTDSTPDIIRSFQENRIFFSEKKERTGKAGALNMGLQKATGDIVVFTDASIILEKNALQNLVRPFQDEAVGVVSGEDFISGTSSEGAYGRYELMLRNLESRVASIVGASGCLYAQRRSLCRPFPEGMAPDFFSVLVTIESGFRAITEPSARGQMGHLKNPRKEYQRKVRTYLRGMTTLASFLHLMNPSKYGFFSIILFSHKLLRWTSGIFLLSCFVANLFLILKPFYFSFFLLQLLFYGFSLTGLFLMKDRSIPFILRIPLFFCMVNISALQAIWLFLNGHRQEIWEPSKR
jgi:cellulose synthase/poly-beta-1,6-N-acetylglucosamine synthase-like glycosyltransferase